MFVVGSILGVFFWDGGGCYVFLTGVGGYCILDVMRGRWGCMYVCMYVCIRCSYGMGYMTTYIYTYNEDYGFI